MLKNRYKIHKVRLLRNRSEKNAFLDGPGLVAHADPKCKLMEFAYRRYSVWRRLATGLEQWPSDPYGTRSDSAKRTWDHAQRTLPFPSAAGCAPTHRQGVGQQLAVSLTQLPLLVHLSGLPSNRRKQRQSRRMARPGMTSALPTPLSQANFATGILSSSPLVSGGDSLNRPRNFTQVRWWSEEQEKPVEMVAQRTEDVVRVTPTQTHGD